MNYKSESNREQGIFLFYLISGNIFFKTCLVMLKKQKTVKVYGGSSMMVCRTVSGVRKRALGNCGILHNKFDKTYT